MANHSMKAGGTDDENINEVRGLYTDRSVHD
jgi:hypothetical protein